MADAPTNGPGESGEGHDDLNRLVDPEGGPGSDPGAGYELAVEAGEVSADEDEEPNGPGVAEVFRSGS